MIIMKSMELDDEDKADTVTPLPVSERPSYPYGLKICLTEKELDKCGIDPSEAFVGGVFHLHGLARVTCVEATDREGGSCCRIEAQIEDLAIESEDAENED